MRQSIQQLLLLLVFCGLFVKRALASSPAHDDMLTVDAPQRCVPAANVIDWAAAREEYFYLHKVMTTELGRAGCDEGSEQQKWLMYRAESIEERDSADQGNWKATLRANAGWLRGDSDPLVTHNSLCNTDIRSHLRELFTFTLFFAPRTIVELGVRTGWSTRAFAAAAKLVGAFMIGVDLDERCKNVYALAVGPQHGFAVAGDSVEAAQHYVSWVADRRDLAMEDTVDLLFIDTSHEYDDTVRELKAWAPLMSGPCVPGVSAC